MNELLSNTEIDALLTTFQSEGDLDGTPGSVGFVEALAGDVGSVDLLRPNRLGADLLQRLRRCFQTSSQNLSASIGQRLRAEVMCDCVEVGQVRFQNWLDSLGTSSCFFVLRMDPLRLPVLVAVTKTMLYGAVDRILGGSGRVGSVPAELSPVEYTVAETFVGPCFDLLCDGLREVVSLGWAVESRFANRSMAQILHDQEVMVSAYFQVSGESVFGDVRAVIPHRALEPYLVRKSEQGLEVAPGAMREELLHAVRPVRLGFAVRLGEARMPLRRLLGLRAGDVVPLTTRVGDPLVAPVQGKVKFTGRIGTRGPRLAFRVESVVGS